MASITDVGPHMKRPVSRYLATWLLAACMISGLPSIAQPRQLIVGVYANEPKILLGQDGKLSGILGELLNEIARAEDWQLRPRSCEWHEC